jgi:hypothetical protein
LYHAKFLEPKTTLRLRSDPDSLRERLARAD